MTNIREKENAFTPCEVIYQEYSSAIEPSPKASLILMGHYIHQYFSVKISQRTINGTRVRGYAGIVIEKNYTQECKYNVLEMGNSLIIPTNYLQNGIAVSFVVEKDSKRVSCHGKEIVLTDIGLGMNTDIHTLCYVLAHTKICMGVSRQGHSPVENSLPGRGDTWSNLTTGDQFNDRISGKSCRLLLPPTQKSCKNCRNHQSYISNKENVPPNTECPKDGRIGKSEPFQESLQDKDKTNPQPSKETKRKEELLQDLDSILTELGMPDHRKEINVDSARNESTICKYQRRWSNR